MNITIRSETRNDYSVISQLNDMAFGQEEEGNIVVSLRKRKEFRKELSLIAFFEGQAVGHILFYPVTIHGKSGNHTILSLGPMCVMPEFQNLGIGSELVKKGLETAKTLGYSSALVLGHKEFYPRFGFKPASRWKISPPFEAPDECFLAIELVSSGLDNTGGIVEYPPEFKV